MRLVTEPPRGRTAGGGGIYHEWGYGGISPHHIVGFLHLISNCDLIMRIYPPHCASVICEGSTSAQLQPSDSMIRDLGC
ncbi:hypothetical protein Metfor_2168 [Methanoregula formicica SMSP]|uniref:Uncharacterized protein n=1 Tax=Methanoregula formicica (strain DSM 22288 / NBRC 105244 / SMSP) TaxID=593750 RepID=L0HJE6_METFS|nr:hypothetical protein Metfor_2168 [Methanoregula formicica SMSP]